MAPPSPTETRGAKSRRVSDEGPSRGARGEQPQASSSHDTAEGMHVETADRLCITVDGAGRRKSDFIRLGVEMGGSGNAVSFLCMAYASLGMTKCASAT